MLMDASITGEWDVVLLLAFRDVREYESYISQLRQTDGPGAKGQQEPCSAELLQDDGRLGAPGDHNANIFIHAVHCAIDGRTGLVPRLIEGATDTIDPSIDYAVAWSARAFYGGLLFLASFTVVGLPLLLGYLTGASGKASGRETSCRFMTGRPTIMSQALRSASSGCSTSSSLSLRSPISFSTYCSGPGSPSRQRVAYDVWMICPVRQHPL